MRFKRKLASFFLAVCLALNVAAPAQTKSARPITLQSAVASGRVEAQFFGTGASSGDSVKLKVKKGPRAGRGPLKVTVPPGSLLRSSSGSDQSMVVSGVEGVDMGGRMFRPTSQIVLTNSAPVTYVLKAFCAEFEKENPSVSTSFTLEQPDPILACIVRKSRALTVPAAQAAVWIYTDRMTFSRVNHKFRVDSSDWTAAETVVAECRNLGYRPDERPERRGDALSHSSLTTADNLASELSFSPR